MISHCMIPVCVRYVVRSQNKDMYTVLDTLLIFGWGVWEKKVAVALSLSGMLMLYTNLQCRYNAIISHGDGALE